MISLPIQRGVKISKQSRRFRQATIFLLCALLVWAPLPLGSNRPLFWVVNGFFAALIGILFLLGWGRSLRCETDLSRTAWLSSGLMLAVLWALVQASGFTGDLLSHPIRDRLSEGIAGAYGAISANPSASMTTLAQITPPILLAIIAALIGRNRRHAVLLIKVIVVSSTVLAIYGLTALHFDFTQVFLVESEAYEGSLTATFVGRNAAATYLAMGLVAAAALTGETVLTNASRRHVSLSQVEIFLAIVHRRGIHLIVVATLLSALLSTGSRAGMAAGAAGFAVIAVLSWRRLLFGKPGQFVIAYFVAGFLIVIAAVSSTFLVHRLETLDPAEEVRSDLYRDTIGMILSRPILGHGAGTFSDLYPLFQGDTLPITVVWNRAHSTYLQTAAEYGLPVFLILMLVSAASIWRVAKGVVSRVEPAPAVVASLGAFVVVALHSLLDFSLQVQAVGIIFAVIAGVGYGEAERLLSYKASARCLDISEEATQRSNAMRSQPFTRMFVLVVLVAGICTSIVAAARLALVVRAVPSELRLTEVPIITAAIGTVDQKTIENATAASQLVDDPALVTALLAPCREKRRLARAMGSVEEFVDATRSCIPAVDSALAANPLSGELWLERSMLRFSIGGPDAEWLSALRRTYETSPLQGWLIAYRVIFGIQSYSRLPDDIREFVEWDLTLVLSNRALAEPLVATFISSEQFRAAAVPVIEALSAEAQTEFLDLVRDSVNRPAVTP